MSMNDSFSNMIMVTLENLSRVTDSDGKYLHVQISFSDVFRMYICLCPILDDEQLFVHCEYDNNEGLDETLVMPKRRFKGFIETYSDPQFIGVRTTTLHNNLETIYLKDGLIQLPQRGMGIVHVTRMQLGEQ